MTPAEISAHVASLSVEEVDAQIALRREEHYHTAGACTMVGDCTPGRCPGGSTIPFPYCGSWEHAGPLLDEMPHARMDPLGEEPGFRVCWDAYGHMGGHHGVKGHPCCSTRTEAISRAWLIANWETA